MKSKVLIILLIILFVFICCSGSVLFILFSPSVFKKLSKTEVYITDNILLKLCKSHENLLEDDYNKWFTSNYKQQSSLNDTAMILKKTFPDGYDCNKLNSDNIKVFDLLTGSLLWNTSVKKGGVNVIDITFGTGKDPKATFDFTESLIGFTEENGEWKIYIIRAGGEETGHAFEDKE